jgi:ATPase family associated with various cellular activities (AAA)
MSLSMDEIRNKLEFYFKTGKNVILEGKHGTGKTSLVQEVFSKNAKKWLYFSGSTLDPWVDFIGVPKEVEKNGENVLTFVLPERMTDESVEAIFIDEYNRSHKKVRNGIMELIQFKAINGRKFPNLKVVWAAVNPSDDEDESYDVETLDPAQLDRFQVQIKVPFSPDFDYFQSKYNTKTAQAAIEWWKNLPKEAQNLVSPRRLDYAIEIHNEKGDLFDVLPVISNPTKLLVTLQVGSLEEKIKKLFLDKTGKEAINFLEPENNFQGSLSIIKSNKEYMKFFLPLVNNERITAAFFSDKVFQTFILENSQLFKSALEEISKLKAIDSNLLSMINYSLQKIGNVTFFN